MQIILLFFWNFLLARLDMIGLIFTFLGTFFIIGYITVDKNEWVEYEKGMANGERWYSVFIKHPSFIKIGLVLIILGFIFSCLSILLK